MYFLDTHLSDGYLKTRFLRMCTGRLRKRERQKITQYCVAEGVSFTLSYVRLNTTYLIRFCKQSQILVIFQVISLYTRSN